MAEADAPDIELLLAQRDWIHDLARRLVKDPHKAADLAQESMLRALANPPPVAGDTIRLRGWLVRVVQRLAYKARREDARRVAREHRFALTAKAEKPYGSGDEGIEIVLRADLHRQLVSAVLKLPEPSRSAVLWRYFEGRSVATIARREQLEPAAVRKRIARGIDRLRASLDARHGGDRNAWCQVFLPLITFRPARRVTLTGAVPWAAAIAVLAGLSLAAVRSFGPTGETMAESAGALTTPMLVTTTPNNAPPIAKGMELEASNAAPPPREPVYTIDAELLLQVVDAETGEPIAGARVALGLPKAPATFRIVNSFKGTVGDILVTDDTGSVRFTVSPGEDYTAYTDGSASGHRSSLMEIAAFEKDEFRQTRIELSQHLTLPFFGKLVDNKTGQPITGAQVWTGRAAASENAAPNWVSLDDKILGNPWTAGQEWKVFGALAAVTRDDGRFEISVGSREPDATARIHLPGYGPVILLLTGTRQEAQHPFVARAARAASLRGVLRDVENNPIPGLRIAVSASGESLSQGDSDIVAIETYSWKARTRADGSFELRGLPAEVQLSMEVLDEQKGTLVLPKSALLLDYAEERDLEWTVGPLQPLRGFLVDESGSPVGGVLVQLAPATSETSSTYLGDNGSDKKMVVTDALGRFNFEAVAPGLWFVGPRAGVVPSSFAPYGTRVDFPFDGPLVLLAHAGLHIEGRYVSDDGQPIPGLSISATMEDGSGEVNAESDAEGNFRIGPLAPGPHTVWPGMDVDQVTLDSMPIDGWSETPFRGWLPLSFPGVIPAGTSGLEIVMTRSGSIKGTAQDPASGNPINALFTIFRTAQGRGSAGNWSPLDSGFYYQLLLPGSYTVVARTLDNRVGVLNGVAVLPDGDKVGLIIPVAEGSVLVVRSDDSGGIQYRVEVDGIVVGTFAADSGAVVVPPGDGRVIRIDGPTRESKSANFIAGELTLVVFDQEL